MESNLALLNLLERILGKGKSTSRGNYSFFCPNCNHQKPKLEVNLNTGSYQCWICGTQGFRGKSIKSLFNKIKATPEHIRELALVLPSSKSFKAQESFNLIFLPKEFIPLSVEGLDNKYNNILLNQAKKYANSRNITNQDILKYNIGFCPSGPYENRLIVPSYDENGILNYFIARDFTENLSQKYKNPPVKNEDVIGMEFFINWKQPIILCEGMFDALTIKRNCIPLFGKNISVALMKKIVTSEVKKIYIALDQDALKDALRYCEEFMNYGKEVYLVQLDGKDASSIGFENFLNTIENTYPLRFSDLLSKKLKLT